MDQTTDSQSEITGTMDDAVGHTGPIPAVETSQIPQVEAGSALLIVRRGPSEGTSFTLSRDVVTVGRSDESDVMLDDVTVSRRHAQFLRTQRGWVVKDTGSLNGTYVNRNLIEEVVLAGGDEVQIGKYRFLFLVGAGA